MKTKIIYISGGQFFQPAEIKRAMDDIRRQLKLGSDVLLFAMPVDEDASDAEVAQNVAVRAASSVAAPAGKKSILGNLSSPVITTTPAAVAATPSPAKGTFEPEDDEMPVRVVKNSDDLEEILSDVPPIQDIANEDPAATTAFPKSVQDLAKEMVAINPNDWDKINESLASKTARGFSEFKNILSFRRGRKAKVEVNGPSLFDWNDSEPANDGDSEFELPPALRDIF
ncbi:MAG: hypothetical protein LBB23_02005 [Rickettsiales bacterium]|jgi:hypothetical protein|nr:hypothetical protein [Rickettsiales bacterium]